MSVVVSRRPPRRPPSARPLQVQERTGRFLLATVCDATEARRRVQQPSRIRNGCTYLVTPGVDYGSPLRVVYTLPRYLVVHCGAGKHFAGIGNQQAHGAKVILFMGEHESWMEVAEIDDIGRALRKATDLLVAHAKSRGDQNLPLPKLPGHAPASPPLKNPLAALRGDLVSQFVDHDELLADVQGRMDAYEHLVGDLKALLTRAETHTAAGSVYTTLRPLQAMEVPVRRQAVLAREGRLYVCIVTRRPGITIGWQIQGSNGNEETVTSLDGLYALPPMWEGP